MGMLVIRDLALDSRVVLAPMAGVNCRAFRVLCRRAGAGLIYSQMINVDDFFGDEENIHERYADFTDEEKPVAAQIIGADPRKMAAAARVIQKKADMIDINFGCCDKAQLAKGAGCSFIRSPIKLAEVVEAVVAAVDVPVTAKIRLGWDDQSINCIEVARLIEKSGASAIAVHARTQKDKYHGEAKWEYIKKVKKAVKLPIIGNGDVRTPELAQKMIEQTGCDAVMIGRAAVGDPHLFTRVNAFLRDGSVILPEQVGEKFQLFLEFLEIYRLQPRQKFAEIRNHAIWFAKGLKGGRRMKERILQCPDIGSIKRVYDESRRYSA